MKLPQITYSQAAGSQTISPGQAVAPIMARTAAIGKVAESALKIDTMINENQVNKEMAFVKDGLQKFENWMATQREFDPEALEAMGIADQIDMGDGGMVPKHKVYSAALVKFTADLKETSGERIGSNKYRQAWSDEVDNMTGPMVEASIKKQEEMAIDEMRLEAADAYQLAEKAREPEQMRMAADRYPTFTPAQRQAKKDLIDDIAVTAYQWKMEDERTIAMDNRDIDALGEMIAEHEDNKTVKGSPWTDEEHNAWAAKLQVAQNALIKSAKREEKAVGVAKKQVADENRTRVTAALASDMMNAAEGKTIITREYVDGLMGEAIKHDDDALIKNIESMYTNYLSSNGDSGFASPGTGDQDVYDGLRLLTDDQLITVDVAADMAHLEEAWHNQLVERQATIRNKDEKAIPRTPADFITTNLNSSMADVGILGTSDDKKTLVDRIDFEAEFKETVSAMELAKGKALTFKETQQIGDNLVISRKETEFEYKWNNNTSTIAEEIAYKSGVKEDKNKQTIADEIDRIVREMTINGEIVTTDSVMKAYDESK